MHLKRPLSIFIFLLFICATAFAQRDSVPLTTIIQKTTKMTTGHPIEKVYLHFDKPYYAVGDTIWFKAYLTGNLHQPSLLSRVVYIDMFSNQDSLVSSLKLPVINGVAWGNISLPQLNFKQGNYHIRAYTAWMRNSDPVYFFNKTIPIGSSADEQVLPQITFDNNITDAVSKINAYITYKDQDGNPYADRKVSWNVQLDDNTISKGRDVTDKNGRVAVNFSSDKLSNISPGNIVSQVEISNKKSVTNNFPIVLDSKAKDVQFFPEGGELIAGVRSRIAVKIVKADGLGIDGKAIVTDNAGATISEFTTQHLGMGVFAMIPEQGKNYKAAITFTDGTKAVYDLPRIKASSVNLGVSSLNADVLTIKIACNDAYLAKNQGKAYYIVGQNGGNIYFAAQTTLQSTIYNANIPKNKFPTGIVQLTLFSSLGEPLSERIAFIEHHDQLNLGISSDRKTYRGRQKVKLAISAKNQAAPAEGNFSVAVIDENKIPVNENLETTILSNILLTSDLRGYVEQPNYYFNHQNETTEADLDILMMTQGYRRFSYKSILADKLPPIYLLPEQGISLSGTLRTLSGLPIFKGNLHLTVPDRNIIADATTNADGQFSFNGLSFRDSSQVTISARNNTNAKNLVITMNGDTYQGITKNYTRPDEISNIDSIYSGYLKNSKRQYSNSRILKEVTIKASAPVHRVTHADVPALTGLAAEADQTIPGSNLKGCNNLLTCLTGLMFSMTVSNNEIYLTKEYNAGKRQTVQVYYNGTPVDGGFLANVNPNDVESIEVFKNDGLSGVNRTTGTNGVLVVNVRKIEKTKISLAELEELIPKQNVINITPRGYDLSKEFYSPKYDPAKQSAVGIDLRSTIYWNPKVVTDKTGNAFVEFFNSDGSGNYRAVIEGIDADGNIGRYVYRYKVE